MLRSQPVHHYRVCPKPVSELTVQSTVTTIQSWSSNKVLPALEEQMHRNLPFRHT